MIPIMSECYRDKLSKVFVEKSVFKINFLNLRNVVNFETESVIKRVEISLAYRDVRLYFNQEPTLSTILLYRLLNCLSELHNAIYYPQD